MRAPGAVLPILIAFAVAAGCVVPSTDSGAAGSASPDSTRMLDELVVARSGSMRGYSRDRFPHWRDTGDNCNVRDSVLRREGTSVRLNGCDVVDGRWYSPYDGRTYSDPSDVDIDHLVPLANAWRSGANAWTVDERGDFANDLVRPQLRAVSLSANRAKGDQDPSQWKPLNRDYWCEYAQDWVAVKHYWRLTVTTAEKAALTDMLETCTWPFEP